MRRLISLFVMFVALSACAAAGTGAITTSLPTTTSASGGTTTTSPSTTTTTSSVPPGPPVGWLAPSGVPLAVTAVNGGVIEVLTPCGDPAQMTAGTPIYDVDVVLDPGHGGPVDSGAVGANGLAEKEINLRVAQRAGEALEERGIATVLTRTGDYPVPIRTRVEYAHLMGAELMVSIHHNAPAAPSSDLPGVEIFVQSDSVPSQRLGGLLYEASMAALGRFDVDWDRSPDAGVMTVINSRGDDAYGMVRLPEMPAALVELGFIANPAEADLYRRPEYAAVAGESIAEAIASFLTSDQSGAALVEGRTFDPHAGVGKDQCVEPSLDLALYPAVVAVDVSRSGATFGFDVTVSSPYDSPGRYADAFRVVGDDGVTYGMRELTHDHATEQPFTRALGGLEIPESVEAVTVEARDQTYGWGGETVEVGLP